MFNVSSGLPSKFSVSSLIADAGTAFITRVGAAGLSFVVQVLFARWAGPDHYGAYSYAMAWAALLSTFSGLGFPQAIVRYIPEYERSQKWKYLKGVIKRSEHFVLGASSILALLSSLLVIGLLTNPSDSLTRLPLLLGLAFTPVLTLLHLQREMCVARGLVWTAYLPSRLLRPLSVIAGGALLVLWFDKPLTGSVAVLLTTVPVVAIWLGQRWAFQRSLPEACKTVSSTYDSENWLRTAVPMLLITGFVLLIGKTDLIMIGIMTDVEQVGLYRVASKISTLVLFPMFAVNAIVAPRFAEQYAGTSEAPLQGLAATAGRWMFAGGLLLAIGILITAPFLLGLFGPSFPKMQSVLAILIGGQIANVGAGAVGPLLTMTGYQDQTVKVYASCALLNVVLNGVGISFFGLHGAAIATAISTVLWNVGLYRLAIRKLDVYPSVFDLLRSSEGTSSKP